MRPRRWLPALLCATLLSPWAPAGAPESAGYDPARDPAADLRRAIAEAADSGKRIVLEVGGEWCVWCHILERWAPPTTALSPP